MDRIRCIGIDVQEQMDRNRWIGEDGQEQMERNRWQDLWIGLDSIGQDWDWILTFDWMILGRIVCDWMGLDRIGWDWIGLDKT